MIEAARRATEADLPALAALHRAATEELRVERGGEIWARQTGRSRGEAPPFAFDDPAELVLAGTIDDVVVGYGRLVVDPFADGGELAVLTDLYVEIDAREVGVGEALLQAAVTWATERGCVGIDSVALPGMRASKNFFEAAGLVARAIVVHRALP
ncbi:MAG TPA: GNAT family N-acetyltransferase [Acidimicrobiales bacterium]|nr:GNAT family N-acetyltransferase [Acidimicrobiales bacterium]